MASKRHFCEQSWVTTLAVYISLFSLLSCSLPPYCREKSAPNKLNLPAYCYATPTPLIANILIVKFVSHDADLVDIFDILLFITQRE